MPTPDSISRETDLSGMEYKWGFTTDVETELAPKGLDESIVRLISQKKEEPKWLLDWRLKAFKQWEKLNNNSKEPIVLSKVSSCWMNLLNSLVYVNE
mgnify:CR=1 FL=1